MKNILHRLSDVAPSIARVLARSVIRTPAKYRVPDIKCTGVRIAMRDGTHLATDVYMPPVQPAPAVVIRMPYGRGSDAFVGSFFSLARRGYVVVSQDCRGTGESEPDTWDYYVYEPDDGYDLVEWVSQQPWCDGFIGSCGSSYVGQTQWSMGLHPKMSTIVPDVSGLGVAVNTMRLHMLVNAYARSVGKGSQSAVPFYELEAQMLEETLETGVFNDPFEQEIGADLITEIPELAGLQPIEAQERLWAHYCALPCADRAAFIKRRLKVDRITAIDIESLGRFFGQSISHDRHSLPSADPDCLCRMLHAPAFLRTGWYDWGLNDALATWQLLARSGQEHVRAQSRLFIGPSAHNSLGYQEGLAGHPELHHSYSLSSNLELLLQWYEAVRSKQTEHWPRVIYYLMGANEWCAAEAWPLPNVTTTALYLQKGGKLDAQAADQSLDPDTYIFDPAEPTPTMGGSIVSYVISAGSVDVSGLQSRPDVLSYTSEPLDHDLDVVGPLRLILYASSSAVDTDFAGRLSDVFPDGRAIQLQNGVLRARYRSVEEGPQPLEPGRVYRLEIDMWATANRFKAGHRMRVDVSSADFPRFDRNSNLGGADGDSKRAEQRIYLDRDRPSHLLLSIIATSQTSTV
jgi:uncharacterized protein